MMGYESRQNLPRPSTWMILLRLLLLVLLYCLTLLFDPPTHSVGNKDRLILASGNSWLIYQSHPSPSFDVGAYVSSRGPHISDYAQTTFADPPHFMIDASENPYYSCVGGEAVWWQLLNRMVYLDLAHHLPPIPFPAASIMQRQELEKSSYC